MLPKLSFILGGAASGKSVVAENLLLNSGLSPVYLATSRIWDEETRLRVNVHQARRDASWRTIEAPFDLGPALKQMQPGEGVLIDCATMWLSNHLLEENDLQQAQSALLGALAECCAPVVIVSNEVGQGIVPENALARRFREAQGRLNIALAAQADLVIHVVAGLSHVLKGKHP